VRLVGAHLDVTEQKAMQGSLEVSERHANVLLAELQHRVRNTLAVVRSIARRTADNATTAEDMLAHFEGKLDAFSRVQAALTRRPDAKVDLLSLVEDELLAHATREGEKVRIDGEPVSLEPRMAERLSLAIHELTTNAVKHGALMDGEGKIDINWRTSENGAGKEFKLGWKESGMAFEQHKLKREGFGLALLRRSLPYDLRGETHVKLEPDGIRFELTMPLPGSPGPASNPDRR
jgi:two-component system CheB/CheR fusion protein